MYNVYSCTCTIKLIFTHVSKTRSCMQYYGKSIKFFLIKMPPLLILSIHMPKLFFIEFLVLCMKEKVFLWFRTLIWIGVCWFEKWKTNYKPKKFLVRTRKQNIQNESRELIKNQYALMGRTQSGLDWFSTKNSRFFSIWISFLISINRRSVNYVVERYSQMWILLEYKQFDHIFFLLEDEMRR